MQPKPIQNRRALRYLAKDLTVGPISGQDVPASEMTPFLLTPEAIDRHVQLHGVTPLEAELAIRARNLRYQQDLAVLKEALAEFVKQTRVRPTQAKDEVWINGRKLPHAAFIANLGDLIREYQ